METKTEEQLELFKTVGRLQAKFDIWVHTPGGRHIAAEVYRRAAYYGERYKRTGRHAGIAVIWELVRDHYPEVAMRAARRGVDMKKWEGYALPDNMKAYMARHIMEHRKDWDGMFVLKELRSERE